MSLRTSHGNLGAGVASAKNLNRRLLCFDLLRLEGTMAMDPETSSAAAGTWPRWFRLVEVSGLLWLLAAIPFFTDAAVNVFVLALFGLSGIVIGVFWLILSGLNPCLLKPPFRRQWLMVPAAGAIGLGLLFTDYGLMLRVALSETALDHGLEAVPSGADSFVVAPRFIGLFVVTGITEHDGGKYLFTCTSFINRNGIARIPAGAKLPPSFRRVHHLYRDWYSFEWKF
jgi:hypothetical protein